MLPLLCLLLSFDVKDFKSYLPLVHGLAFTLYASFVCRATLGTVSHALFGLCFVETPDYGHLAALGFLHGLNTAARLGAGNRPLRHAGSP